MRRASHQSAPDRVRVQFDLRPEHVHLLDWLRTWLGARSRADLLQEAIGTLLWVVHERRRGRRVVSIDPSELGHLRHAVEWASAAAVMAGADVYAHLVERPHPWRRQLWVKGRNLTVGQLVATMQAERMTPEETAQDLDLPIEQVREALVYYAAHRDLVDAELLEEKQRLEAAGYAVDPRHLPG